MSSRIWQMKAWAILLVICAHCAGVFPSAPASKVAAQLLQNLGALGVPIFFFLAGYVFRYKALGPWLKGKLTGFVVPWLFTGTAVYLYVYLRKGGISLSALLLWLVGSGSYLWYLTVQALLWIGAWILFWGREKRGWQLCPVAVAAILASAVVLLLQALGIIRLHVYLNPLRWLWVFALGLLAGKETLLNCVKTRMWISVTWLAVLLVGAVAGWQIYYGAWYYTGCALATVIAVGCLPAGRLVGYLERLGRDSFAVYLLHMPVAGLTSNLCSRVADPTGLLILSQPLLVLVVTHGAVVLLRLAANWMWRVLARR